MHIHTEGESIILTTPAQEQLTLTLLEVGRLRGCLKEAVLQVAQWLQEQEHNDDY